MNPRAKQRGGPAPRARDAKTEPKAALKTETSSAVVFYPREPAERSRAPEGSGSVIHFPR